MEETRAAINQIEADRKRPESKAGHMLKRIKAKDSLIKQKQGEKEELIKELRYMIQLLTEGQGDPI